MAPIFRPVMSDSELKKLIIDKVKAKRKLVFRLEKFTFSDPMDGPKSSLKRKKQSK